MTRVPDLSVVVPCYNESASLSDLERELTGVLQSMGIEWEVILIDDGSKDSTGPMIREIASRNAGFIALEFSRNFGKEAAMLAGLEASRGRTVVIMDGDLQHPPRLIPMMYEHWMNNPEVDQVVARRNRVGDKFVRTQLSKLYYKIINSLLDDVRLTDGVGDFRLMSRSVVDALLSLPERKRFSKGLFEWVGFKTETINYGNEARVAGESSWSFGSLLNYGIDGVLAFNTRPLRLMVYLGLVCFGLALIYFVSLVVGWFINGTAVPGYITTVGVVTLFAGVQLISLGVIGEYIGAVYQEVKRRPRYIVKATTSTASPAGPGTDAHTEYSDVD